MINTTNLNKLPQISSINELLTSAIDIIDDLTNKKMPEYKNELEKNKCFFIDMFKTTHADVKEWTLDEVRELLSILKTPLTNITDNKVETKKIQLIKEIELIEKAIETYNEIQKLKINQLVINNLVSSSIDIIEQVNRPLAQPRTTGQKSSLLATAITDAIFNSLSNNTFNKHWESLKSSVNISSQTLLATAKTDAIFNSLSNNTFNKHWESLKPSVNISSQTMKNIYNNAGKRLKGMFSHSMIEINKYLDILNKNTINGKCAELNKIVLVIANDVCEILKQFTNTQSGTTTAQSGTVSNSCDNFIKSEFQLLGRYDNADLYYNGKENKFCTNNLNQTTTTKPNPNPNPNPNPSANNLNTLVNIAVDVIDNIKKQNTNLNILVDTAVNILSNPLLIKS